MKIRLVLEVRRQDSKTYLRIPILNNKEERPAFVWEQMTRVLFDKNLLSLGNIVWLLVRLDPDKKDKTIVNMCNIGKVFDEAGYGSVLKPAVSLKEA
jgi:hypothetical protein